MKKLFFLNVAIVAILNASICYSQEITSIERASLAPLTNSQGESYSYDAEIDGAGRYVIFTSTADNFAAPGNTNGLFNEHVYLRDLLNNTTSQLDVTTNGDSGSPAYPFNTGIRTFSSSLDPHISKDGKVAAFISSANNISPEGDGTSAGTWVYLKSIETGSIKRIPFATAGISGKSEYPAYIAINGDGTIVVIMSIVGDIADTNCSSCAWELTVYDDKSGTTTLIDTGVQGNKFNPDISYDGRFIVFENQPGDFSSPTYSYMYDRTLSVVSALNAGNRAQSPAISGDGKYIAYTDIESGSLIKLLERESGAESTISLSPQGEVPAGISEFASLDHNGRYLAFLSSADNLVEGDDNGLDDIFVYDRVTGKMILVSVQAACSTGFSTTEHFNTGPPSISANGKVISFTALQRLTTSDVKDADGKTIQPADTDSGDDVYIAQIDYEAKADVFKEKLKPEAPLVSLDCTGQELRLSLDPIVSGKQSIFGKIKSISQQIIIQKIDKNSKAQTVRKLNSKKLQLTAKSLASGNYSAQVQVIAKYAKGKTLKSKTGSAAKFSITTK